MDKPSENRIRNLHPLVRKEVTEIVKECDEALTGRARVRITQGLRSFKDQDALYAQGRTKAGKKVTNAKAGQSIHNYGLAVDICLIIDGKVASWDTAKDWDNDGVADWYECVKIFARHGWSWGGNWKTFKDLPHFERSSIWKGGRKIKASWRNLQNLPKDKDGYVIFTQ
ncbi:M15 family metallopeptidase [Chryseobacterium sp. WG23]|uniref:M15 family metallopeptidase n=1 Tax=Chryseobacterium sp. WG23 TaxID=2926910 RepID=UPI00211E76AE|nr:M15 family metallopeptidase [Chryseobacterium sp. WG23]MCQ9635827.1 M15 family metallopeptidase [Chryseobacterium sp. WG23]